MSLGNTNSAKVEAFTPGMHVKLAIGDSSETSYVGRVTHVVPKTDKVYVEWPIGYPTQHDPWELIIVSVAGGISPITSDTGYSTYDKAKSEALFGKMPKNERIDNEARSKMASSVPRHSKVAFLAWNKQKFLEDQVCSLRDSGLDGEELLASILEQHKDNYPLYVILNVCGVEGVI